MPQKREFFASLSVTKFRLVTQGEKRFSATGRLARSGDLQNFIGRKIRSLPDFRTIRERTITTHIPAESGQGNEDLARVTDSTAMSQIPLVRGLGKQLSAGRRFEPMRISCHDALRI